MKRVIAATLCGALAMPVRAMRMDYFESGSQSAAPSAVRKAGPSWLRQELLKRAEKPGEDGFTPAGRWLVRMTAAGILLTAPAANAVGQALVSDFMGASDLEEKKSRRETGVVYLPASREMGVMAAFQGGEFMGVTGHPETGRVRNPLADIANDDQLAGGSVDELKALVSTTAGVILKSPDRKDMPVMIDGNRFNLVEAPGLKMAALTGPDGQVVDLLHGTGLTAVERMAGSVVAMMGAGQGRPAYERLGLEPDVFQGAPLDTKQPAKSMSNIEALGATLNLGDVKVVQPDSTVAGRQVTMYKTYEQWRAENSEKAVVDKPGFGAAFNEKGLGLVDNAVAKPVSLGVGVVVGAIKTFFGAITTAVMTVANVVTFGQWGKGREMLAGSAASTWAGFRETIRSAASVPAGVAGWLLSFSPKGGAIRNFSERLDNWSLRGAFVTDDELIGRAFQHKADAKYFVGHGIDNNGAEKFKNKMGDVVTFQQKQAEIMMEFIDRRGSTMLPEEKALMREVIRQTDFVAVYNGNPVVDIMLMSFERAGLHVATRKVMEPFLGKKYEGAYFHSAGGAVGLEYHEQLPSDHRAFIGAAGMHDGWYKGVQADKIQNKGDITPNVGPNTTGDMIGAKVAVQFGGPKGEDGGIVRRQALSAENPRWWKLWELAANHSYMDYFVQDQLNRMRTPPSEIGGISVKDQNFEQKLNDKIGGLGR
jgi:hypothetical protein